MWRKIQQFSFPKFLVLTAKSDKKLLHKILILRCKQPGARTKAICLKSD